MTKKPLILCILDGWGIRESAPDNAIAAAYTPCLDKLFATYPHSAIKTDGMAVGLPEGQMGNSEVGHMNIGAGRIVMQTLPRIDASIASGAFAAHPDIKAAKKFLSTSGGRIHIAGLLSPGGVHSHSSHIIASAKIFSDAGIPVALHLFTDGRDVPPKSAEKFFDNLHTHIDNNGDNITVASICGRYFAMDRDKRSERTQSAYDAMIKGKAEHSFTSAKDYISSCYHNNITDEFFPAAVHEQATAADPSTDVLFFCNFRADRMRQLAGVCIDSKNDLIENNIVFTGQQALMMSEYDSVTAAAGSVLFPPGSYPDILGELLEQHGKKQLRIAETEKYAHVTFFFNGGREEPFRGESRILVPSPDVATYDEQPEMSAPEVTDKLIEAVHSCAFDMIILNYANTDMVGHTGVFDAAKRAIEAVDTCLSRLVPIVLAQGGALLITADHGNAEQMLDASTGAPHTAHTMQPVPLIYVSDDHHKYSLNDGRLCDIAPTALACLDIEKPEAMTGVNLLSL